MSNRFKTAIDIQDAVNLRAIAREFVRIVDEATDETRSTERTWHDPAVVLLSSKIASLTSSEHNDTFRAAYAECQRRAQEPHPASTQGEN